jgi:hypothetical protein
MLCRRQHNMDYLFRWMELRFLSGKQLSLFGRAMARLALAVN